MNTKFAEILDLSEKLKDRRYFVVGDIHACYDELMALLDKVGFKDPDILISIVDLFDRVPKSFEVCELCRDLQKKNRFYSVRGNHDQQLLKYLKGKATHVKHGMKLTLDSFQDNFHKVSYGLPQYNELVLEFLKTFPRIIKLPNNIYLVHGGFNLFAPVDQQDKDDVMYMRYVGGEDHFDSVNGIYWFNREPIEDFRVIFGHEYMENAYPLGNNKIIGLDGGCVFGQELRVWDSLTDSISTISAFKQYWKTSSYAKEQKLKGLSK